MIIEIRKSESKNPFNRYYYAMVAANDQDLTVSEMYFSKGNCMRAARKLAKETHTSVQDSTVKPYTRHGIK